MKNLPLSLHPILCALRACFAIFVAILAPSLHSQSPDDLNEGSRLVPDTTPGYFSFSWWGREDWTYFVQNSDDLRTWTYLPIIEQGEDAIISYGFAADATIPFFLRLRLTDQPAADPWATDFGAGLPAGFALEHGLDPFDPEVGTSLSPHPPLSWQEFYQMSDGLIVHYPLLGLNGSGQVPDLSSSGHHGQLTGSHATFASIDGITALHITGNLSGVILPTTTALQTLPADSYTLSVWYKATDLPGTSGLQTSFGLLTKNSHFALRLNDSPRFHARFNQQDTGGTVLTQRASPIYSDWDRWYHLVQVVDYAAGQTRFYVNGSSVGTNSFDNALPPVSTSDPWRIGFRNTGSNHWSARGYFTDVRLYDRVLSATEAAALTTMAPPDLETHADGLPAWWKLQHFGTLGVDPEADPDEDGLTNLQEFLAGTDPNTFDPPPIIADTSNQVNLRLWSRL